MVSRHVWRALSRRWVAHGRTGTKSYHGLSICLFNVYHGLSRATAITLAHLIWRSARNAAGKGQGCPPASRHFCQATICSAGARCRASIYNCSSTHLQYFACFSLFFIVFPYFYKSPKFSLCHDSMSQAQKENVRNKQKQ